MKITKEKILEWKSPPDGFFKWLLDIKPMIPSFKGGFEVFQPTEDQRTFFENALATDDKGDYKYQTLINSAPRRHSKTVCMGLLVLWRFFLFPSQTIIVLANSSTQAVGVSFKILKQIILNTPFLRDQLNSTDIQAQKIIYRELQSTIEPVSCQTSALYGRKISVGWTTEIHGASDGGEAAQILASSIGDTKNSWMLIDSSRDHVDGPLHLLEKASQTDETIYFHLVEYKNLQEAVEKSPPWIDRKWLKSRQKQLLPQTFNSQHLNLRGQSENSLFDSADIKKIMQNYKNPLSLKEFEKIADGRKYVIGAALDRAMSFSRHGDKTVWLVIGKIQNEDQEDPLYYILHADTIFASLGSGIKKQIAKDFEEYHLTNICLESYNSQDIFHWCLEMGYPCETVTPSAPVQTNGFMDLANIVSENRLFAPKTLIPLYKEMEFFGYAAGKAGYYSFGSKGRKDDFVYSLCWAVYSLRKQELNAFELDSINCFSKSKHAPYCYLRNGDLILNCSDSCQAAIKTNEMWLKFKARNPESDLNLPEFFQRKVKLVGTKTYRNL